MDFQIVWSPDGPDCDSVVHELLEVLTYWKFQLGMVWCRQDAVWHRGQSGILLIGSRGMGLSLVWATDGHPWVTTFVSTLRGGVLLSQEVLCYF